VEKSQLVNLHKAVLRRNDLYRRALLDNDIGTALKVEQVLAKLLSLYPTEEQTIKHTGAGSGLIQIVSIEAIQPASKVGKDDPPAACAEATSPAVISVEAVEPPDMG
jgi:hypothetical protein